MFDLRTEIKDAKTGEVVKYQPYTMEVVNGSRVFIRDGKKFHENGEEVVEPKVEAPKVEAPKADAKTAQAPAKAKDSIAS